MEKLLSHFDRKSLTILITVVSILLAVILMNLIYRLAGHEMQAIDYWVAVVIPMIIAPVVTWHLFGILVRLFKKEKEGQELLDALNLANQRLMRSQMMAKLGSWHLNINDDVLYWSDEIYRIFEINPERFGASYEAFLQLIHPKDRIMVNDAYLQSLRDQKPYSIEHRLLMPDGRIKYVREECVSTFDENGKAISSEGTVQDITEQVRMQLEAKQKQAIMTQQSKLAQMGEMLNNIAHQWKQPLAQVNSILIDMDGHFGTPAFNRKYFDGKLDRIEELTTYMSDTIEQFSSYFNPNKEESEFEAAEVIQSALALLDPLIKNSKVKVLTERFPNIMLHTYKQELTQVLLVLIHNACDALSEGDVFDPTLQIRLYRQNKVLRFDVIDNARGIPDELIDRIFEPYFTTKEYQGGTGIGLYMAKVIVENSLGGKLLVQSSPQGSTFSIIIDV